MKKIVCYGLAVLLIMGSLTGCGKKDPVKLNQGKLYIASMGKGLGTEYLNELIKGYNIVHPEVTVVLEVDEGGFGGKFVDQLPLGPDKCGIDLMFISSINFSKNADSNSGKPYGKKSLIEDLTDLYDSYPVKKDGTSETIKIKDKMRQEVLPLIKNGEIPYVMPYAGGSEGMIYNKDVLDKLLGAGKWTLPVDTDALIALVNKIKDTNKGKPADQQVAPFVWAGANASEYWDYLTNVWWAQYEGFDNFNRYWSVKNEAGQLSPSVLRQDGRLEALNVLESLIADQSNSFQNCESILHTDAQYKLLTGKAAMMPTAYWMETEMKGTVTPMPKFLIMPTPYLSSALKKWTSDTIDGEPNPNKNLAMWDKLKNLIATDATSETVLIPSFSTEIKEAKDFLRFMMSDDGIATMIKTAGTCPPLESYEKVLSTEMKATLTPFQASNFEILKTSKMLIYSLQNAKIRYLGGMPERALLGEQIQVSMYKKSDKKTALEIFNSEYKYYVDNFENWKITAGGGS